MITKIRIDKHKSISLVKMANISLERLEATEKFKYPTNTLIDYYDIIHKLLEALSLLEGIKATGQGAHQDLIEYISKKYSLGEQNRKMLQEMREYRNRISYEGFMIKENYITLHEKKIQQLIDMLLRLINTC